MIKRTVYFGNPTYLSLRLGQMEIRIPEVEQAANIPEEIKATNRRSVPIEDLGIVLLDHKQITITNALLSALVENNCAVVCCDETHHPSAMLLSFLGHTEMSERVQTQLSCSLPLKKQLWQQTIRAKIANQSAVLTQTTGRSHNNMTAWIERVRSGDSDNMEARAAVYYWPNVFPSLPNFRREREGLFPNKLLNYGYAIVRAMAARAIVAAGLLPSLGIFHHNKYNHFCLADDIMEPYRPYVDLRIYHLLSEYPQDEYSLTLELKKALLSLPVHDVCIDGRTHPMSIAMQHTATSLYHCYSTRDRKLKFPTMG